jgi:uncharacterized protein (TIGR02246 family)
MNRLHTAGLTIGLLAFAAGCSQAPPPAPPDTRAADEKTIRDNETAWSNEWGMKDADKILAHYADDASLMIPNMPVAKGKDAIKTALTGMLSDKNLALSFAASTAEVSKSGDLAYTQGTYTLTMTNPKTKKPVTEKGKYVTIYKKQSDGSWKAIEDINNADAPAAPAAAK